MTDRVCLPTELWGCSDGCVVGSADASSSDPPSAWNCVSCPVCGREGAPLG